MRFVVKRYWEVCDTVDVAADGVDEAIEAAHALPIDRTKAAYVADSLNSDPESDVRHLPGGVQ